MHLIGIISIVGNTHETHPHHTLRPRPHRLRQVQPALGRICVVTQWLDTVIAFGLALAIAALSMVGTIIVVLLGAK